MNKQKLIIIVNLFLTAVASSQNLQTSKDSIKIAILDIDKATEKMIEGKQAKEQLKASNDAFDACNEIKAELKGQNLILKSNLINLKDALANSEQNTEAFKKVAENEKNRGIRRGFYGFLKGVGVTVSVVAVLLLVN
ncbi:hypothetical protein lotta81_gp053 [Flavobacterium phage vB_FspM_lotta8-1]|uniref:Uncharacterized protein n=1 Tax=Flavobacterium phage vB_FspM_lotta8-1 TaxID=2686242 RepID=A0A6B9LF68_9CAUD|nr:hypothetical protein HWC85_gp53 [Flavobacterium phage vB_FspM_lotta8-1]QHB38511.1 hypothetical protein lotta81_gp053 [Flavobacterium phage vB_FspM_lotta8-1]